MVTATQVRRTALALDDAVEAPHHGFPSFRVAGKIFATLPDAEHLHVMLDPEDVESAIEATGASGEPLYWGKRLCGVRVTLATARLGVVRELLERARVWRRG